MSCQVRFGALRRPVPAAACPGGSSRLGYRRTMHQATAAAEESEVAADLAGRIASGDPAAEAELVERYSRGVFFMLRHTTGDFALAEDLHQETFRIVLERLRGPGLADPGRLAGFLQRTARNLSIGEYRKQARRPTDALDELEPPADPAPGQLSQAVLDEEAAVVRRLIGELRGDRDRQVLYRFYIAEEPKQQICDELGLSSLHFNRVLHRARQRFKDLFEREGKRDRLLELA